MNISLYRVWAYLWNVYRDAGGVPPHVSDAIALIQDRMGVK